MTVTYSIERRNFHPIRHWEMDANVTLSKLNIHKTKPINVISSIHIDYRLINKHIRSVHECAVIYFKYCVLWCCWAYRRLTVAYFWTFCDVGGPRVARFTELYLFFCGYSLVQHSKMFTELYCFFCNDYMWTFLLCNLWLFNACLSCAYITFTFSHLADALIQSD